MSRRATGNRMSAAFGEGVRATRVALGMSGREVSESAGLALDRSRWAQRENGNVLWSLDEALAVAGVLGCTVEELCAVPSLTDDEWSDHMRAMGNRSAAARWTNDARP